MLIYVASPYTHSLSRDVETDRYFSVMRFMTFLADRDRDADDTLHFSPILYCHDWAKKAALPSDYHYWAKLGSDFIKRSDSMYVLCLDGWRNSLGVTRELEQAARLNLPLVYYYETLDPREPYKKYAIPQA